jgi:hypothetical protein
MVLLIDRGEDLREVNTQEGRFRMWTLSRHVYASELVGHMMDAHVDLLLEYGEERVRRREGKLSVFHEWTKMTGYTPSCRARITSWTLDNREAYSEVHVAFRSKLVAMGVQVANLALGGMIRSYSETGALQVALRAAMLADNRGSVPSVAPRKG